ncbi:hypothetical protein Ancab_003291 [Ancistrocladus abbreviatus]
MVRDLKENHPGHPLEELGSSLDPNVSRVGPSPCTNTTELYRSKSRPATADDMVTIVQQTERLSPPSLQVSGPSKAIKGRSRIPIITMGRFKIGMKKKRKHQRKGSASRSNELVQYLSGKRKSHLKHLRGGVSHMDVSSGVVEIPHGLGKRLGFTVPVLLGLEAEKDSIYLGGCVCCLAVVFVEGVVLIWSWVSNGDALFVVADLAGITAWVSEANDAVSCWIAESAVAWFLRSCVSCCHVGFVCLFWGGLLQKGDFWGSSGHCMSSLLLRMMERAALRGQIPVTFFSFPQLQTVILKNNELNGTLDIGTNYSSQLQLVDLQNNLISEFTPKQEFSFQLILVGNPYCHQTGVPGNNCTVSQQSSASHSTQPKNCTPAVCTAGQISSPNCKCAYPYIGALFSKIACFPVFGSSFNFHLLKSLSVPVDSVSQSNAVDVHGCLYILLEIFPAGQVAFNKTGISTLGLSFSSQTYKPPNPFDPYDFIPINYAGFAGGSKSSRVGIIIGATVGGIVLILLLLSGFYAYYQKGRADRATRLSHPFANWVEKDDIPQLKEARSFSLEEIKKCTNNFSEANNIGAGGYGKVYKGIIADGQIVAIKRSQAGSMQGSREFKTEIELLSRVHHKNLVKLVGFCYEQGEQMLVYEFLPNGTLMDSLSGIPLSFSFLCITRITTTQFD